MLELERFGWNSYFEQEFAPYAGRGYCAGRVVLEHKHVYRLYTAHGELQAEVAGKVRHNAQGRQDLPAVGDWVILQAWAEEGKAIIHGLLPRKSKFARKVAGQRTEEQIVGANMDTVFLVTSLNHDFNLRRMERYLAAAWESMARPVILLSKADLCMDVEEKIRQAESVAYGVPIHAISVVTRRGLDALEQYFATGQTIALLGSSGVGKSTLINHLVGREIQRVQGIRPGDERGRHTTAARQLILLPQGGLLLDTPGMRELGLWGSDGLRDTFEEIEELAGQCHFRDCRHQTEPDCAVRKALADGALDPARYQNYDKLQRELRYLEQRQDNNAKAEQKKKVKTLMLAMRKHGNRW